MNPNNLNNLLNLKELDLVITTDAKDNIVFQTKLIKEKTSSQLIAQLNPLIEFVSKFGDGSHKHTVIFDGDKMFISTDIPFENFPT